MTLPGFHAEASLPRSAFRYPTAPRPAVAGHPIRPMWTEEQRQLIIECDRRYTSCEQECDDQNFPTYEERQACNVTCNEADDVCLAPLYGGSDG
ncbi:hypothetical protein GCM10010495_21050 [Kitasatospora herbaricolor]|uniref:hypothetical protein n=1 Tax=Kitasatospora herbaricolor TaxID=68217 RepID=UPI00174C578C|nr:hypothetical protein [Kitasatospora herbaricolor]MDQ0310586.1 hypothetical protein [Kitasatospora herbaricolor]GGV08294.1 hypothetical protein GCM10010495_21050 [Kitasatospora herbaricolor]